MQLTHQYFSLVKRMNLGELLDTVGWLAHDTGKYKMGKKNIYIYTYLPFSFFL